MTRIEQTTHLPAAPLEVSARFFPKMLHGRSGWYNAANREGTSVGSQTPH